MSDLIDLTETFYLVLWIRFILGTFYFGQDIYVISLDILSTLGDHPQSDLRQYGLLTNYHLYAILNFKAVTMKML